MRGYTPISLTLLAFTLVFTPASAYGPTPVSWPFHATSVCFPWVATREGTLFNLVTGAWVHLYTRDLAVASCTPSRMLVVSPDIVAVVSKYDGRVVYSASIPGRFIGAHGSLAAFLVNDTTVAVTGPGGTLALRLACKPLSISLAVDGMLPAVVYTCGARGNATLYETTPAWTRVLARNVYGPVAANESLVAYSLGYILAVARLEDGRLVNETRVYTPLVIDEVYYVSGRRVVAHAMLAGVVVVDVKAHRYVILGPGEPTPAGVYTEKNVTVLYSGGVVPGKAVAVFHNSVLIVGGSGTVLYPLRPTVLVLREPVDGLLTLPGGFAARVSLTPGKWLLPRGAAILTNTTIIAMASDEVEWPPANATVVVTPTATVKTEAMVWPPEAIPFDAFSGARKLYSGDNHILVVREVDALVYGLYGRGVSIPGRWLWGGVGRGCIVLYDGAALRVYDYSGEPLAAYKLYAPEPLQASCEPRGDEWIVTLRYEARTVVVTPEGVYEGPAEWPRDEATGVTLEPGAAVVAGVEVPLPVRNPWRARIDAWRAAWWDNGTLYVYDAARSLLVTVVNAPPGVYAPLGPLVARLSNGTVTVYPLDAWLAGCYVRVEAPDDALVYVDGRLVSRGPVTVYAACGEVLTIRVEREFCKPAEARVAVVPGGVTVTLQPARLHSNVTVVVEAPRGVNITAVVLSLNGRTVVARPGESVEIPLGRYNVTVRFVPDVCKPVELTGWVPRTPRDALKLSCRLVSPLVVLVNRGNVTVEGFVVGPVGRIPFVVGPGSVEYVKVLAGEYSVVSRVKGLYRARNATILVPRGGVAVVDVTPEPMAKLVVRVSPRSATVRVINSTGAVVATGRGGLTLVTAPGVYRVLASAPGYRPASKTVELKPLEEKTVTLTLRPVVAETQPPPPWWANPLYAALAATGLAAAAVASILWRMRRRR